MNTKVVTFRCPLDLLKMLDKSARHFKRTRNTMLLTAVRLFSRQIREQSGNMVAPLPADTLTPENMFLKPETKGGRPRTKSRG